MDQTASRDQMRVKLTDRAFLRLEGPEARSFIQGLISNDIDKVTEETAIYAALLTPQGKFLFDFLILQDADALLFDCEAARAETLRKRLTMYKMRAAVTITDVTDKWSAYALFPAEALEPGRVERDQECLRLTDPRLAALGQRLLVPEGRPLPSTAASAPEGSLEDYTRHCLTLGVPVGGRDILPEVSFLLESNVEELHGVDFRKGCYVGQELTARTKHRGSVRKRILPLDLAIGAGVPDQGTPVQAGGKDIGTVTSGLALDGERVRVLALIRVDRLRDAQAAGQDLSIGGQPAIIHIPDWVVLPETA